MEETKDFLEFYEKNKEIIKGFLKRFKDNSQEKEILGELVFCICTPQSRAKYCRSFVESIKEDNSIFSLKLDELRKRMNGIRFSDRKAEFIMEARKKLPDLKERMTSKDHTQTREWLIKNVKGLGMKESAHLLRNLGVYDFPIIDIHIQNFLRKMGMNDNINKSLTKKRYINLEKKFLELSEKLNMPPEELDIAIWLYQSGEKEFYG